MKQSSSEPTRLLDLRSQDDPANLARLIRSATRAPAEPVPRLKGRIRCSLRRESARRQRILRAALLGGLVCLGTGVMAAVMQPVLHLWENRKDDSLPMLDSAPPAARARHRRASALPRVADGDLLAPETGADLPSLPTPAPAPPLLAPATAINKQSVSPASAHAFSPRKPLRTAMFNPSSWQPERPPSPNTGAAFPLTVPGTNPSFDSTTDASKPYVAAPPGEQALLTKAIRSLRSEHKPGSALAVLDEYLARFPSGSLLPEATRLRTEALLALGHKPAALAELNRELAPGGAGREESHLVRGELHAAAGRWPEALGDFDSVVRAFAPKVVTSAKLRERFERALWGRACARSHLGDEAGARADLRECLRRFPQGRFAGQAAHLLSEQR